MSYWGDQRSGAVFRAKDTVRKLEARGITIPKAVTAAVDNMRRIEAERPGARDPRELRELILNGAGADTLNAAILADLGASKLNAAYQEAALDAGVRVGRALRDAHDELHPQLAELAAVQIDILERVARLPAGTRLQDLVAAGDRQDDAHALATAEVAATELDALYELRAGLWEGGHAAAIVDGADCTTWRDPRVAQHHAQLTTRADYYVTALRGGSALWFPDLDAAIGAAEPIARELVRAAERLRLQRRQQGVVGPVMF